MVLMRASEINGSAAMQRRFRQKPRLPVSNGWSNNSRCHAISEKH
jgi:hypothetical protein